MTTTDHDPVWAQRARMAHLSRSGKRLGYGLYVLAIALFGIGASASFTPGIVNGVVASLAVGSVALVPSIIVGYGVKAADREDRREGRAQGQDRT
ncbi:MAG: hypothetical protein ACRD0Q_03930 [Acidimicrobiales bacterium]